MADVRLIKVSSLPGTGIPFATYFVDLGLHYAIHQANESGLLKPVYYDFLPDRTGNNGKALTLNAGALAWEAVSGLPDQTGNGGKVLATNGTIASWINIGSLVEDGLITPGFVTWTGVGLNYDVSAAFYRLLQVEYNTLPAVVASPPADPALPRLDIVLVNNLQQVILRAGTPAADPVKPQIDPETEVELTTILIGAGATTPTNIISQVVYDENAEIDWVASAVGVVVDYDSIATAWTGVKSALVSTGVINDYLRFLRSASDVITDYDIIKFALLLNAPWLTTTQVGITFYNAGIAISNEVVIQHGKYGIDRLDVNYQLVQISLAEWSFISTDFDEIRYRFITAVPAFTLDRLELQGGVVLPDLSGFVTIATNQTITGQKPFTVPQIWSGFTPQSIPFIGPGGLLTENNAGLKFNGTYVWVGADNSGVSSGIFLNGARASIDANISGMRLNVGSGFAAGGVYDATKSYRFMNRGNLYLQISTTGAGPYTHYSTFYTIVRPATNNAYNLGEAALRWANVFSNNFVVGGSTSGLITIAGKAVAGTWQLTLPDDAGTNGYVLATDGNGVTSWIAVSSGTTLPDQTGNNGKVLFTDGTNPYWDAVDALPAQTTHNGKYLRTDGTNASWEVVIAELFTGFTSGPGTVSAADSILSAIQKLNGNVINNTAIIGSIQSGNNLFNYFNFS